MSCKATVCPEFKPIYLEFNRALRESYRFFRLAVQYVASEFSSCFLQHQFNVRELFAQYDQCAAVRRRMFMMGVPFVPFIPFAAVCAFFLTTGLDEGNCQDCCPYHDGVLDCHDDFPCYTFLLVGKILQMTTI